MRTSSRSVLLFLIFASAAALGAVLIGQYFYGLRPCHLCLYQRWPFGAIAAFALTGLALPRFARPAIFLSGIAFAVNAGIAVYHSGVERKYWAGLEGCSTPDLSGSIDELMLRIKNAAVTSCDEIAFQIYGLSIANLNVIYCAAGAVAVFMWLATTRRAG